MLQSRVSAAPVEAAPGRYGRLARAISNVFSPPVLSAPLLALAVRLSDVPGTWRYAALYAAVGILTPLLDLAWLLRTGRISDFHLARRSERTRPFVVSILSTTVALGLLAWLDAPPLFVALVRACLLQALLLFAITLAWQISIHSAAAAGLATLAVLGVGLTAGAAALVVLVPVVGWARLHLRRHTLGQVLAGAAVGSGTLVLTLHGVLW
jgi:hypothetical protein